MHAPKVELKPLSPRLRYEFLSRNRTFLVIISSRRNDAQIDKLLFVLQEHRGIIGYGIKNIKGISP